MMLAFCHLFRFPHGALVCSVSVEYKVLSFLLRWWAMQGIHQVVLCLFCHHVLVFRMLSVQTLDILVYLLGQVCVGSIWEGHQYRGM